MTGSTRFFILNGKVIEHEALKSGELDIEKVAADDFENNTLVFARDYLQGRGTFTVYTSGSTGYPKPIEIKRNQMCISAMSTVKTLGLTQGDMALVCINTAYIGGKMMLVRGFEAGLKLNVVSPVSNPLKNLNFPEKIDFTALVPLQLETILTESPDKIPYLNQMKAIILGGAPVNKLLEEMVQQLEVPVYSTYGMTETVSHIALKRLNGKERQDYFETFPVVNIGQDERGCLTIHSILTNLQTIVTNDIVEIIDHNKFRWIGRIDNVINSGGVKILTEELEKKVGSVLNELSISHPFFIGSLPDDKLGQQVALFMEDKEKSSTKFEHILGELLRKNLSKYEVPKTIIYLDKFIYTETGKIKRKDTINKYLYQ